MGHFPAWSYFFVNAVVIHPIFFLPPHIDSANLHSFYKTWGLLHSSLFCSTLALLLKLEEANCPLWLAPEHSWLFVLAENVIKTRFTLSSILFSFFKEKHPVGKTCSLAILEDCRPAPVPRVCLHLLCPCRDLIPLAHNAPKCLYVNKLRREHRRIRHFLHRFASVFICI